VSGAEDEEKRNIFYFYLKKCACPTFRNVDFAANLRKTYEKLRATGAEEKTTKYLLRF